MDENDNSNVDVSSPDESLENVGMASAQNESSAAPINENDPESIKARLGRQAKKHAREIRNMQDQHAQLQSQLAQLQSQMTNPNQTSFHQEPTNPYSSPGQPSQIAGGQEDLIQRAVQAALMQQQKAQQDAQKAQQMQHVQKQYEQLNNRFDSASDKYDDFDDVVRRNDVPFTSAIRDALLLVDNPEDVAYKLGKNRDELSRISQLHPLDQAKEVTKLSFALMGGNNGNPASQKTGSGILNQPKANPAVNSSNYSASSIRARMKSGAWK